MSYHHHGVGCGHLYAPSHYSVRCNAPSFAPVHHHGIHSCHGHYTIDHGAAIANAHVKALTANVNALNAAHLRADYLHAGLNPPGFNGCRNYGGCSHF